MAHGHAHDGGGHGAHEDKASGHAHAHGGAPCSGHGSDLEQPLLGGHAQVVEDLQGEQSKLKMAVYFALFMMFVEIFGGIMANSLAIITDAAHMLSDVGGFIVSLVCLQLSTQGLTHEYTYGFKQAEVLGALLSIAIVWALTACLLKAAYDRFWDLEEINAPYMFWISVLGFFVNLALMKVLGHGHAHGGDGGHGHSHGGGGHDEHDEHDEHASEEASLAMRAAIAHVVGDIVQSLGVCLAALCIWVQPFDVGFTDKGVSKWNYADPCCTVLFGILVLFTTKSTLVQTIDNLMVKAPKGVNQTKLADKLKKCHGVVDMHDLHVWGLGSKDVLCTAHLVIASKEKGQCTETLKDAINAAKSVGIGHSTFQIEVEGEFDPALESYGFHENPVQASPVASSPVSSPGHGHAHDGHACDGHGHAAK